MRRASYFVIGALASAVIVGCGESARAKAPFRVRIPLSTAAGYVLGDAQYTTLYDLDELDGELASVRAAGALDADADVDEIVLAANPNAIYASTGRPPRLDYDLRGGVAYPRNFDTMAMMSIYYNYERVVEYWTTNFGLTLAELGKNRLFYKPTIRVGGSGGKFEATVRVNAAFIPGPRDFLFFKTSRVEDVPVIMNLAVIAHEFGHSAFDIAFARKDPTAYKTKHESNAKQLSGMNEGVADFFSFVVTGRVSEFSASSDQLGATRIPPVAWTLSTLEDAKCAESFYCKGSILNSAIYEIATTGGRDRLQVGRQVFAALAKVREDWDAHKDESTSSFDYFYLVNRILGEAGASKEDYCVFFKKWFDSQEFIKKLACA